MRTNDARISDRNQASLIALALAAASLIAAIASAETPAVTVAEGGKLWLEGDSTLHKYKSNATAFHASIAVVSDATGDLATIVRDGKISAFVLTIPIAGLKSGEGGLDDNMYKALKSQQSPDIVFRMTSYSVLPGKTSDASTIQAHGMLSIAGVEKDAIIDVEATAVNGGLHLVGSHLVRMTDHGIQPPVLMLGMIRCADQITVHFDLRLRMP